MTKVALVTGIAGFIGSHMADVLLEEGYEVRGIDNLVGGRIENLAQHKNNPKLKVEIRDIRQIAANDSMFKGVDYIFHFAGIGDIVPSIEKPYEYMEVNVLGTVRVLEAARQSQLSKLVYAASSSCYGKDPETPTSESSPISAEYPYALSKLQGEEAVYHWAKVYKIPVNTIRIFNAYGIRSRTSGAYGAVFGVFLKQKLEGKKFTVVGDGSQRRDFLYASDVARAFLAVAKIKECGEVFNLGAGNPQSVNYLVQLLKGEASHIPKRPGEPDCTWADISKITRMTDWRPQVSFEEGVSRMLAQIDYWRAAPLWDEKSIREATKTWFEYLS